MIASPPCIIIRGPPHDHKYHHSLVLLQRAPVRSLVAIWLAVNNTDTFDSDSIRTTANLNVRIGPGASYPEKVIPIILATRQQGHRHLSGWAGPPDRYILTTGRSLSQGLTLVGNHKRYQRN